MTGGDAVALSCFSSDSILHMTVAYFLDLALGDPQRFPHPVRWMGFFIGRGEKILRGWIRSRYWAGTVLTIGLVSLSFFATVYLLKICAGYSKMLASLVEIYLLYSCFSTRDLAVETERVRSALNAGDIPLARKQLSWIVGRDTDRLEEKEIVRAAVETVAENTVDGIVAPIFYAAIGGAPLCVAYKMINTLDSMIAHPDEEYREFGRTAATVDTWSNWIPARLAGFLFPLAARLSGFSSRSSYRAAWELGLRTSAPNSSIPEAAMAGALQIQIGGTNFYKGTAIETPKAGEPIRSLSIGNISEAIKMMYAASLIFFSVAIGIKIVTS